MSTEYKLILLVFVILIVQLAREEVEPALLEEGAPCRTPSPMMTRPTASPAGTIARMDSAALRLIIEGKTIKFFIRLLTKEDRLEERVVAGRRRAVTAQTAAAERSGEREKKERREEEDESFKLSRVHRTGLAKTHGTR
jgi:ribosomal protein L12E/L44/L45/RPP1/RPP2